MVGLDTTQDGPTSRAVCCSPFRGEGRLTPRPVGATACMQPDSGRYVRNMNVRDSVTMRRALRIGLFIGTLIGMSACATQPADNDARGPYGSIDAGRTR